MKRHTPESITGATILFGCGIGLVTLTRLWGIRSNPMFLLAAGFGPIALVLGVGMAIHGRAMPVDRVTMLARIWGIAGSIVSVVNLQLMGYFATPNAERTFARFVIPLALLVAWLLPARFYGDREGA
jgi:hypothetical protein